MHEHGIIHIIITLFSDVFADRNVSRNFNAYEFKCDFSQWH